MSQDFRSRYQQLRDNDPTKDLGQEATPHEFPKDQDVYDSAGYARNLCFIWPDGRRFFLNYSYLVSGDFNPDQSAIELIFTTHKVVLAGIRLEPLFAELMDHRQRIARCTDK